MTNGHRKIKSVIHTLKITRRTSMFHVLSLAMPSLGKDILDLGKPDSEGEEVPLPSSLAQPNLGFSGPR